MGILLKTHFDQGLTLVPNQFIDTYMPHANGSFVKVYLLLARQTGTSTAPLTLEGMADMLSNTEADIVRALHYWEKQGIVALTETGGTITGVELLPLTDSGTNELCAAELPDTEPDTADRHPTKRHDPETAESEEIPGRHNYTPLQAEALKKDTEIESCLSMVEALLGTTLGDAHMQLILYLMSDLGFSLELVITLYETALARGKSKPRYIEAIALDWAKKGIQTAKEAEDEASSFNGTYKIVASALGIRRALAPAEKAIIDKWDRFHFPDAVLEEACSRTVLQSGDTNLNYTSKILEDWHSKGVTSLKDIEDCDRSYFRQKNATANKTTVIHRNKFQNFPQRSYSRNEYKDLEKKLLHQ